MDEMDGIFTNTTTATDDYFKESITANVTIPLAVLKELMGIRQKGAEDSDEKKSEDAEGIGIPETIQWYKVQDKAPNEGSRCLLIYPNGSEIEVKSAVFMNYYLSSCLIKPIYWAYVPKGPEVK